MTDSTNLKHKDWEGIPEDQKEWWLEHQRNWRSWGSWFSWGSPVGLGIWFVLTAGAFWIIMQAIY